MSQPDFNIQRSPNSAVGRPVHRHNLSIAPDQARGAADEENQPETARRAHKTRKSPSFRC